MRVADTLLKEKQIEGKNNVNQQRTTKSSESNEQPLQRPMEEDNRVRKEGRGVI